MKRTVLFAWELGSGGGHVGNLVPVARELATCGYQPVFAVRDVTGYYPSLESTGFPVLQAPQWPFRAPPMWRASCYADILAVHGYRDAEGLSRLIRAWEALFQLIRPALIVADHSPTVCLAAAGSIPLVLLGNGFTLPPVHLPVFPRLRPRVRETLSQEHILKVIRKAQAIRHRASPETLPALFEPAKRFVLSLPELDPYRAFRREPVLFPFDAATAPQPLPAFPSLYAYCSDEHPELAAIAHALAGLDARVSVHFRERRKVFGRFLAGLGVNVYWDPPPYGEVLSSARIVLSQAGQATAHAALITGRPQALSPIHLEAELTTQALVSLGVGIRLPKPIRVRRLRKTLQRAMKDEGMEERAVALAGAIAARPRTDTLSGVVSLCGELAV
uniref:UDP:flavonoid glycosyltransferase YjiC, YdhE family n=1 Tax=Candidatus Kentrum sp. DK TaxID=2126562 RepID=A0A450TDF4_9GAMM|nr:MAG: UDP:flavonoid glycosyltransferase YjiC, YdhE family [Candidatus Kentron sp. DK]